MVVGLGVPIFRVFTVVPLVSEDRVSSDDS